MDYSIAYIQVCRFYWLNKTSIVTLNSQASITHFIIKLHIKQLSENTNYLSYNDEHPTIVTHLSSETCDQIHDFKL
ncbi:unnamed protein product [Rotaria magnacalcarata]